MGTKLRRDIFEKLFLPIRNTQIYSPKYGEGIDVVAKDDKRKSDLFLQVTFCFMLINYRAVNSLSINTLSVNFFHK